MNSTGQKVLLDVSATESHGVNGDPNNGFLLLQAIPYLKTQAYKASTIVPLLQEGCSERSYCISASQSPYSLSTSAIILWCICLKEVEKEDKTVQA